MNTRYDPQTDVLLLEFEDAPSIEIAEVSKIVIGAMSIDHLLSALASRHQELEPDYKYKQDEQIADLARKLDKKIWRSHGLHDEFKLASEDVVEILEKIHEIVNEGDPEASFRQAWHEIQTGQTKPIAQLWDDLAEQEFLEYLESIGAIRDDGTIDRSKIEYFPAQTFEELEALLRRRKG